MPRRSSTSTTPKRRGTDHDFAVTAFKVVEQAIGEKMDGSPLPDPDAGKNPHAVALGRLGGQKGGKARAEYGEALLKRLAADLTARFEAFAATFFFVAITRSRSFRYPSRTK